MPEKAFCLTPCLCGLTVWLSGSKPWSAHLAWISIPSTSNNYLIFGRSSGFKRFLSSNLQSNSSTFGWTTTFDKYRNWSNLSSLPGSEVLFCLSFVFWSDWDFALSFFRSFFFFSSSSSYSFTQGIITSKIVPLALSTSRGTKLVSRHIDLGCIDLPKTSGLWLLLRLCTFYRWSTSANLSLCLKMVFSASSSKMFS